MPFSISTVTLRYGEDDMSDVNSCISMALYYIDLFLPEAVLVIGSPLNFFFFASHFVQNPFQFLKINFKDIQNCKNSLFIIKLEQIINLRKLKALLAKIFKYNRWQLVFEHFQYSCILTSQVSPQYCVRQNY